MESLKRSDRWLSWEPSDDHERRTPYLCRAAALVSATGSWFARGAWASRTFVEVSSEGCLRPTHPRHYYGLGLVRVAEFDTSVPKTS